MPEVPPPAHTRLPLRSPTPGAMVEGTACLRKTTPGTTKAGAPYLTVELCNSTGMISGKIWSEHVETWSAFPVGAQLFVRGVIKAGWNNNPPEISVSDVEMLARPHEVELEINPVCPVPLSKLRERFEHLLATMTPRGAELVRTIIEDVGEDDFWLCPAAKIMHHAYMRGLAEHSIEVAELALAIARTSPHAAKIQYDLLLAGALLHDLAKVREYRFRGCAIELARTAHLTYHTCSGPVMTQMAVERHRERLAAAGVTQLDVEHLCHVQLSHHGVAEFGSPVPPASVEATIIHHADNISAKVRGMIDDLSSATLDAEGWVTPTGWKRSPVLSPADAPQIVLAASRGFGARAEQLDSPEVSGAVAVLDEARCIASDEEREEGYWSNIDERPRGIDVPLVRLRIVP